MMMAGCRSRMSDHSPRPAVRQRRENVSLLVQTIHAGLLPPVFVAVGNKRTGISRPMKIKTWGLRPPTPNLQEQGFQRLALGRVWGSAWRIILAVAATSFFSKLLVGVPPAPSHLLTRLEVHQLLHLIVFGGRRETIRSRNAHERTSSGLRPSVSHLQLPHPERGLLLRIGSCRI